MRGDGERPGSDAPPLRRGPDGLRRTLRPIVAFLRTEAAGGVVLLLATAAALAAANSPWGEAYHRFWQTPAGVLLGPWSLGRPLEWWVNDGLMVLFFFVVGLEIKHELVAGELRDPRMAALPAAAALGGMIVPALVYFTLQRGAPGRHGWGVPMATDIAFALGVLTLLGSRVPAGLKVMLLSLAIVDDLGAVVVIAVAYSSGLSFLALAWAGAGLGAVVLLLRAGVRVAWPYGLLAAAVWLAFVGSGVHPTVAGVLLGLLTPSGAGNPNRPNREAQAASPLDRLERSLHPWVALAVMPLFALANAGVPIDAGLVVSPVSLAVIAGLVLGKPVGIVLFSLGAVRLGVARLPGGVTWGGVCGVGCLGGVGFTMSLFIAALGLEGGLLAAGKVGTLAGSAASAAAGAVVLLAALPRRGRPAGVG